MLRIPFSEPLKVIALAVLFFILAACTAQESTPSPPPTNTEEATGSPNPTSTTAPTLTPTVKPSPTPEPTAEHLVEDAAPEDILGILWQWQAFQDTAGKNDIDVGDPEQYTLTLHPNGSAAIQADCNQASLGYILEGSSISFSAAGPSTSAFCGEDSLDQQYLSLLADAATWVMSDQGNLVLNLKLDAGNMIFESDGAAQLPSGQPETAEPDITGILWEWQAFQDTAGLNDIAVDEPASYTFILDANDQANIQADCNQLSWGYVLEASSLTFDSTGTSTLAYCGEDSLDQQYLTLLANVAAWIMTEDGNLVLNLWADGGNMIFASAATAETSAADSSSLTSCTNEWFMADSASWNLQRTSGQSIPTACPEGSPLITFAASQPFEHGRMIWLEQTDAFYILFNEGALSFDSRQTFLTLGPFRLKPGASVDNRVGVEPPSGLEEPISGFGHIWRNEIEGLELDIRAALGWGLAPEFGFDTALQCQEQETYSERTCYLLDDDGSVLTLSAHAIAGNVWWLNSGQQVAGSR